MYETDRVRQWLSKIPQSKEELSIVGGFTLKRRDLEKVLANSAMLEELDKRLIPEFEYAIAIPFDYGGNDVQYTVPDWDLEDVKERLKVYKRDFTGAFIAVRFQTGAWTPLESRKDIPEYEYDEYDD
jgi:hypothetical protein